MKHLEQKYRVDSFNTVLKTLKELNATYVGQSTTTHYYAQLEGNNVVKLVDSSKQVEIHQLSERGGRFELTRVIPLNNAQIGLKWLSDHGFSAVSVVRMIHDDYEYHGGTVRLYTINEFLLSVILDFPAELQDELAAVFNLQLAERITLPYNKYLEQLKGLETFALPEIRLS